MRARWAVPFSLLVFVLSMALVCPAGEEAPAPLPGPRADAPAASDARVFSDEGTEGLTLEGRVLDASGAPVAGADVHLAASSDEPEHHQTCPVCGELLLACAATPSVVALAGAWSRTDRHALRSLRTDAEGRFRFEGLRRASVAVWAIAEGFGEAVREGAVPGEPVELRLHAARRLTGRVIDDTGAPIANAEVLVRSRVPLRQQALTTAEGTFALGVGDGPFEVIVQAEGHVPALQRNVQASGEPLNVLLWRSRQLDVVVFRDGAPAEAAVQVTADHLAQTLRTEGGFVRFEGLQAAEVTVTATQGALAATAKATLKGLRSRAELHLGAGGTLAVTVVDPSGQPVPSPRLLVQSGDVDVLSKNGGTGERMLAGPLPQGTYSLLVEAEGFESEYLELELGTGERALDVVLEPQLAIRGRVVDVYGRAAAGVVVSVSPVGEDATTLADGSFVVRVPMEGVYSLAAHHSDWGGTRRSVSAPASGVELTLDPQGTLRATVTAGGVPVEGASLTLGTLGEAFTSDRPSSAEGVILMRGLPAGAYAVQATHERYLASRPVRVDLQDGATREITVELRQGKQIRGVVRDERGAPIPDAQISIWPETAEPMASGPNGEFAIGPVREDLRYRVHVHHLEYASPDGELHAQPGDTLEITLRPRGRYFGRVSGPDGVVPQFTISEQDFRSADGSFEALLEEERGVVEFMVLAPGHRMKMFQRPAGERNLGTLVLERAVQLRGVVVDEQGAPQADVAVQCGECLHGAVTSADGRFELDVLEALDEPLLVSARRGSDGVSERVRPGAEVVLRLQRATPTTLRVFDPMGQPAVGAAVLWRDLSFGEDEGDESSVLVTGADGTAEVKLTPGRHGFGLGDRRQVVMLPVTASTREILLGPAPGTGTLVVTTPGYLAAVWVVPEGVDPGRDGELLAASRVPAWVMRHVRGRARFEGIPPGRYTVFGTDRHAGRERENVSIAPGEQQLQLRLR